MTVASNNIDTVRDLERLRRIEADLREGEAFSQAIFNAAQTGLMVVDIGHEQIMDANLTAATILGYEIDELIGNLVTPFCPPHCEEIRRTMMAEGMVRDMETTLLHKDGHEVPVILSLTRVRQKGGQQAVLSFLDISERKAAEEALRRSHRDLALANEELKRHKDQVVQSEKLASIGQLAAGVAHEINNPVGFVTSNLGTLSEYVDTMAALLRLYTDLEEAAAEERREQLRGEIRTLKEEEDLEFILEDVENVLTESMEGVHRVAEIVQNLKSFARSDSKESQEYDVNEGIEAMIKMVWNELKYNCEVRREYGEIPSVRCHAGQINQVIMNMLVNASHAMPPGGGTITVGTRQVDDEIEIRIADTGQGIPQDIINRIFDPFFTTKDVGKGTGLGLSISHGIIQDHGGRIEVESEVGKGTTFRIYLPLSAPGAGEEDAGAPDRENKTADGPEPDMIG